jgi:hypothetical protein
VLLLESFSQATSIENEVRCLEKLDSLGMKTPKRYKQITFVDEYFNIEQHGLVVQKIKGAVRFPNSVVNIGNMIECFVSKTLVAF